MRLFVNTIDESKILDVNPFEQDMFNRLIIANNIIKIFENTDKVVISLNSDWGNGKTTFLKMLYKHLASLKYNILYINAFEDDHVKDPLTNMLAKISNFIYENRDKQKVSDQVKILIKNMGIAAKNIFREAAKAPGYEDLWFFKDNDASDELYKLKSNFKIEWKDEYKNETIIIIDELDRCKPTYAIEYLEFAKHIFDIHNVKFILSYNKEALINIIKNIYGNIDANQYLSKFHDIEIDLFAYEDKSSLLDFENYINKLYSLHEIPENVKRLTSNIIISYISFFRPSLREISKIMRYFTFFIMNIDYKESKFVNIYRGIAEYLCIMKVINNEEYNWFRMKSANIDDIFKNNHLIEYIKKTFKKKDILYKFGMCMPKRNLIQIVSEGEKEEQGIKSLEQHMEEYEIKYENIVCDVCKIIDSCKIV